MFGNKPAGFGSTFGSQPQSSGTTGLFGSSTATNAGGSLFGGTATGSLFGQQPTTQCKYLNILVLLSLTYLGKFEELCGCCEW